MCHFAFKLKGNSEFPDDSDGEPAAPEQSDLGTQVTGIPGERCCCCRPQCLCWVSGPVRAVRGKNVKLKNFASFMLFHPSD